MRDPDHQQRVLSEVQAINRHAAVADLKADCEELAAWFASLSEVDRERLVVLVFGDGCPVAPRDNPKQT
ncbi:hypothetical protein I6F30_29760 [Bradyrhizobium sp. NBAIM20]|uniref:hypothetical protein n=1 Tax=unclassified Bradyrhizobium TaxID=2631580 RepID=UPI001CD64C69|nr:MULTISPECIES: hypothetical protein [unclassified Bradyrhizobium]MCA1415285.1 hypothetical protein [Bradyrhizobium sp. NBAIM20]MCA1461121.1 hypothetical protein [Bradyrhizobium sp. NBAIM18]